MESKRVDIDLRLALDLVVGVVLDNVVDPLHQELSLVVTVNHGKTGKITAKTVQFNERVEQVDPGNHHRPHRHLSISSSVHHHRAISLSLVHALGHAVDNKTDTKHAVIVASQVPLHEAALDDLAQGRPTVHLSELLLELMRRLFRQHRVNLGISKRNQWTDQLKDNVPGSEHAGTHHASAQLHGPFGNFDEAKAFLEPESGGLGVVGSVLDAVDFLNLTLSHCFGGIDGIMIEGVMLYSVNILLIQSMLCHVWSVNDHRPGASRFLPNSCRNYSRPKIQSGHLCPCE